MTSYFVQENRVRYECTCSSLVPIAKLYFCRHCLKLRCGYCVCHEVDSHYCSNCMEHLPSAEAKLKKNRCPTCLECPNCFQAVSVRSTIRSVDDGPNKTSSKHYYLACFFCRWTTREVGIPDQVGPTGYWPLKENPFREQLSSYLEYYKMAAFIEKNQKEKKPFMLRRGYSSYLDKFGLTNMIARKRAGLPSLPLAGKEVNSTNLPSIQPCVATDIVEPLKEDYLIGVPDLTNITTISQRHANPMLQAETSSQLHPQSRQFYIKRSLRCRQCEHNVSKPEYNPGSIKFKIQLSAYYHVPEVRIMSVEPLKAGRPCQVVVKMSNPTLHLTSLNFTSRAKINKGGNLAAVETTELPKKNVPALTCPIPEEVANASVELPKSSVVLPPRDDAAEYDDSGDTHNFQDDSNIVVWRKGNKAAVKLIVTPYDNLTPGTEVMFSFSLEYGYVNTMPTVEQKQPLRCEMQVNVLLAPGQIEED